MSNIIEFPKAKPRDGAEWIADLSLFEDGDEFSAKINSASVDMGISDADMLRKIADNLETIAFMARQEAERYEESERGQAMAVFTIFADGSVRSRLDSENIVTEEQFHWAADCLDLMSASVRAGEV
jgi:hypothetical protein